MYSPARTFVELTLSDSILCAHGLRPFQTSYAQYSPYTVHNPAANFAPEAQQSHTIGMWIAAAHIEATRDIDLDSTIGILTELKQVTLGPTSCHGMCTRGLHWRTLDCFGPCLFLTL